ncbi:MAG: UDP-N-acetylmuramoyl-L-alanine--D-glutamate ligase [Lachnospiraceae bacterium]|nr:UDP-N-acetylmuramoyl-L-alanine--D-glutamate ligase [Lachnospiraceae bacterium]
MEFTKRDFKGKKVLVAGSGISGIGAAKMLSRCNAVITLYDGNASLKEEDIKKKLDGIDVKIVLGELKDDVIADNEIMIISPGIPIDAPFVNRVREAGVTIWGEIELAYRNSFGKLAAITGTNGKTTTTSLVGEIMKNTYNDVYVVGNIGTSYADVALDTTEDTVSVAEISSFQLESIENFRPDVSAILNITPDHLNRHYTMENYTAVKMSIASNQDKQQICVLNYEDKILAEESKKLPARVIFYSSKSDLEEGVCLAGDNIVLRLEGKEHLVCGVHDMKLVGIHNVENVMAAAAISYFMGSDIETIRKTIKDFNAVEHRIEYVTEKNGVIYYNDSKGTNTDASIKAIEAMSRPTVLIAGGYDKGSEFDDWIEKFDGTVKQVILIGATKQKIAAAAHRHGYENVVMADSLAEAVNLSSQYADKGDAVLLSPACASWDMFKSYEERGRMFKELISNL